MNAADETWSGLDAIDQRLLNDWQRAFPLVHEPFAPLAAALGLTTDEVLARLHGLHRQGAFSRIGGTWAAGAGGAALLCAYAVPAGQLDAVAAQVTAHQGVNHNYEREHRLNLWFVITGGDAAQVDAQVDWLDTATGLQALRLAMQRAYRIDLGFDLRRTLAAPQARLQRAVPPVAGPDRPLAAWLEGGLPLVHQPYHAAAAALGCRVPQVLDTLRRWLQAGTLRRLGVVVRHHELGFMHNAMCVFDVPDDQVDTAGTRLAACAGVTLAYRRCRAPGWPYNLYAMVHGRCRDDVRQALALAAQVAGLQDRPCTVLFSRRRFKQQGGRYFSHVLAAEPNHA